MLLTKLFSGLLAAVMVALGAGQIGNKNTQVGDELVVESKTETVKLQDERWFMITTTGNQALPENQQLTALLDENVIEPDCGGGTIICAVKLDVSGSSSPESLLNQSVLTATTSGGADFATPNPDDSYRHKN